MSSDCDKLQQNVFIAMFLPFDETDIMNQEEKYIYTNKSRDFTFIPFTVQAVTVLQHFF